ncbi:hypothetical protein GCM10023145_19890 [Angustibacter luteus]
MDVAEAVAEGAPVWDGLAGSDGGSVVVEPVLALGAAGAEAATWPPSPVPHPLSTATARAAQPAARTA